MSAAPGWYPDGQGRSRYWNGTSWAPDVAPLQAGAADRSSFAPGTPAAELAIPAGPESGTFDPRATSPLAPAEDPQALPIVVHPPAPVQAAPQPTVPAQPSYAASAPQVYALPVQPVYVAPARPGNGLAVGGFVVGLLSIFMPFVFGLVVGATGLGLSIGGLVRAGRTGTGQGLGIAGLILSIFGLILII